ncbi:MAG TPA: hypothetical protein VIH16_12230 [Bellilinea sp.]
MKIVSNEKLIKRNKKIGQVLTMAALAILGIGLYFSFARPEEITITFGSLLIGFLLTQVGVYYGNRWGRSPRPDEMISANLKGLEDKYVLYHYTAGIPHLLTGPTGVWAIVPTPVGGKITYDESKGRFRQKGGNFYLKLFGQDSIGRPELDAQYALNDLMKSFKKNAPELALPDPQAVVVFTNPKVEVDVVDSPTPAVHIDKLKDFIRKQPKATAEGLEVIKTLQKALPSETTFE